MSDKTKLFFAFALGAIAGAAIVKLLDSEKGEELIAKTKEKFSSAADDIKNKINELEKELAELINTETELYNDTHA